MFLKLGKNSGNRATVKTCGFLLSKKKLYLKMNSQVSEDVFHGFDNNLEPVHVSQSASQPEHNNRAVFSGLKVPDLKKELKRRGLPTVGIKKVLIDRLCSSDSSIQPPQTPQDSGQGFSFQRSGPTLSRIPFGSRLAVAEEFAKTVKDVVAKNDFPAWEKLFKFGRGCLGQPRKTKENLRSSLSSLVRGQVSSFADGSFTPAVAKPPRKNTPLSTLVAAKIGAFDTKGAVRLVSSNDRFLKPTQDSLERLKTKHPPCHPNSSFPERPDDDWVAFSVSDEDLKKSIRSFRPGSAGGIDGLTPQHLKDITADGFPLANRVLSALSDFMNKIVLPGRVPAFAIDSFFGAQLFGLEKPNNGCRPIAIGMTLRRLAGKLAMSKLHPECQNLLRPNQLGVGVPRGCEAIVHAVRRFVSSPSSKGKVLLKIDMANAFNSIRRDKILHLVKERVPCLFPMAWQAYGKATPLFFADQEIQSCEGVQQGDPLGPFLFSLGILDPIKACESELTLFYLDDGTLGGDFQTVLSDLSHIVESASALGLKINMSKCELTVIDTDKETSDSILGAFRQLAPDIKCTPMEELCLLGAPILPSAAGPILVEKLQALKRLSENLKSLDSHDGFFLLKNCFAIPKLLYTLRSSPCFHNMDVLKEYDEVLRSSLESILNVHLLDRPWSQASLPVSSGGLGIRRATDLAVPTFLSSANGTQLLVNSILTESVSAEVYSFIDQALECWRSQVGQDVPLPDNWSSQSEWDGPICDLRLKELVDSCPNQEERAIILSVSSKNSSDWLHALPVPSLGLKLDDSSLRIAIGIRLSTQLCHEYTCKCGTFVNSFGRHGLGCKLAQGRHPRHRNVNKMLQKALGSADFPSLLEPSGLSRDDGKRPDGLTYFAYENGKNLIWDFTCPDTLCASNLSLSIQGAGKAAERAESRKRDHYTELSKSYHFVPVACETLGAWAPSSLKFMSDLGKRIRAISGQRNSSFFLFQSVGMEVQRGNAASIMGTLDSSEKLEEIFYL